MSDASKNYLQVVRDPSDEGLGDPELDIVAVHGLSPFSNDSNAISTWKADNGKVWISDKDFLPAKIPRARIMIFAYNSNPAFSSSAATLDDHAKRLLTSLRLLRSDCPERVVIFICHSLGGLLVKRALVIAWNNTIDKPLYSATYGVVFFGTPHRGGNKAGLGQIAASIASTLAGKPSTSFLTALKGNTFFAESQRDDFLQRAKDFKVVTFFESNPKLRHMVVTRESAIIGLSDENEVKIPMDADHSGICKFREAAGADFDPVWRSIQLMARDAILQRSSQQHFPSTSIGNSISGNYVERFKVLSKLQSVYSSPSTSTDRPRIALVHGLPGSGKTQLIRRFAKEWAKNHEAFYWFDASSSEILVGAFQWFASQAKLEDCHPDRGPAHLIIEAVCKYVQRYDGEWLLVFDNFDLAEKDKFDLCRFFPLSARGTIIVTSRSRDVVDEIGGQAIEVGAMSGDEAVDLFEKSAGICDEQSTPETKLLKDSIANQHLCGLPLAIEQAGAYLRNGRVPKNLPLNERLERYRTIYKKREAKMLAGEGGTKVIRYGRSVIATWNLLFQIIYEDHRTAAELLLLLGMFHHANIPRELFQRSHSQLLNFSEHDNLDLNGKLYQWMGELLSSDEEGDWDPAVFDSALSILESYSLLHVNQDLRLSVHPLVHTWAREGDYSHQATGINARAHLAVAMLAKSFRKDQTRHTSEHLTWSGLFFHHILSCIRHASTFTPLLNIRQPPVLSSISILRLERFLDSSLLQPEDKSQYLSASLLALALGNSSRRYGIDNISTLQSLRNMLFSIRARLSNQEGLLVALLQIPISLTPIAATSDPSVRETDQMVTLYMLLAHGQASLGQNSEYRSTVDEALQYCFEHRNDLSYHEYLEHRTNILGAPSRPELMPSDLLMTADAHFETVRNELGSSHPHSVRMMTYLAGLVRNSGDIQRARKLYRQAWDIVQGVEELQGVQSQILNGLRIILSPQNSEDREELARIGLLLTQIYDREEGKFDEEALAMRRQVLSSERLAMSSSETKDDPAIHDGPMHLDPALWTPLIELLVGYHAFGQASAIPTLWAGVLQQAKVTKNRDQLLGEYEIALQFASEAALRQGYNYYALLLTNAAKQLNSLKWDSKNSFSELNQLTCLKRLWENLLALENSAIADDETKRRRVTTQLIDSVFQEEQFFRPTMLYMIQIYTSWLLKQDKFLYSSPLDPRNHERFLHQIQTWFGRSHRVTQRAKMAMVVAYRSHGEHSNAVAIEHEFISRSLASTRDEYLQNVVKAHTALNTFWTSDAAENRTRFADRVPLETLMNEYKRRSLYAQALRIYEIKRKIMTRWFGMLAEETVIELRFAAELYGRLGQEDKILALLSQMQEIYQNGDQTVKVRAISQARSIANWCVGMKLYSAALIINRWVLERSVGFIIPSEVMIFLEDVRWAASQIGDLETVSECIEAKALLRQRMQEAEAKERQR